MLQKHWREKTGFGEITVNYFFPNVHKYSYKKRFQKNSKISLYAIQKKISVLLSMHGHSGSVSQFYSALIRLCAARWYILFSRQLEVR